ncbi:hypothetical protein ACFXKR_32590 [Streptomyces violascens]
MPNPGNSHIAVAGQEHRSITDSRDALQILIRHIKAGQAGHLL